LRPSFFSVRPPSGSRTWTVSGPPSKKLNASKGIYVFTCLVKTASQGIPLTALFREASRMSGMPSALREVLCEGMHARAFTNDRIVLLTSLSYEVYPVFLQPSTPIQDFRRRM
jgi:hypothetical protein